jgi:predicted transcriptional regulator
MDLEKEIDEIIKLLIQKGITERKAEDVALLLRFKPPNVRRAFFLRLQGKTQEEIGKSIGVTQPQVSYYFDVSCEDVKKYLKNFINICV